MKQYSALVHVGATKDSVMAARAAILDIIKATPDRDAVAVAAIETLAKLCSSDNSSFVNCTFTGGR